MSQYIASSTYKTAVPQGESEKLTAFPIYAPGSNTFWGGSRVQAERLAEELNRLLTQLEVAESERDELRAKIADLAK
jgi:hypothetical protein